MSDLNKKTKEAGLLASLLMCFPQISSIDFDFFNRTVLFSFAVNGDALKRLSKIGDGLSKDLPSYWKWMHTEDAKFSYDVRYEGNVSLLELTRDTSTLTHGELSLITSVLETSLGEDMRIDYKIEIIEELRMLQERIINSLLRSVEPKEPEMRYVAYREQGRVMIHNKVSLA